MTETTYTHRSLVRGLHAREVSHRGGFALIVTLLLMVIIAVVAVGMLTLSGIAMRSSSIEEAQRQARANARLALVLALGELQKTTGSDKIATATSESLSSTPGKPGLTGVWESWNYNPSDSNIDYAGEKKKRFVRWLISDADLGTTSDITYSDRPFTGSTIKLLGAGSLGSNSSAANVLAGRVPVSHNGKVTGAYAWHIADESVKARINHYRDPSRNETLAKKRSLLAGHRPDVSVIHESDGTALDFLPKDETPDQFNTALASSFKLLDLAQTDLLAKPSRSRTFRNDVTPYSLGLLVDARNGGLRKDLSSMFESSALPTDFASKKLYQSTHGITGVSDPYWSALAGYYGVYKGVTTADTLPTYAAAPKEVIDATRAPAAPRNFCPAPVIAKVELLFTMVVRNTHGANVWVTRVPQASGDPLKNYMLHMVIVPVITLHNPYNIALQFDRMQVVIRNVPMGFNFYVNDQPQNNALVSLDEMFVSDLVGSGRGEKSFALDIANWSGSSSSPSGAITMKPGQTTVWSPQIDPNESFGDGANSFFDPGNVLTGVGKDGNVTVPIKAKQGFTLKAMGFDIDWLTPEHLAPRVSSDGFLGVLGLRLDDKLRFDYSVLQPTRGMKDRFQVTATLTSKGRAMSFGGMIFEYGDQTALTKYFPDIRHFPRDGSVTASDLYVPNSTPLSQHAKAKAVALFSAIARTSNGGVYETGSRQKNQGAWNILRDGQLAGKPFLYHNPASPVERINLKTDILGNSSHEVSLQPLTGEIDDVFEVDALNRGNILTGNTTSKGIKSGSYLELPTGPMQTLADFRRSNALTTPFMPGFVQPVANSSVSPMMATNSVSQTGPGGYALLDHSVLSNHALYDGFYFSTVAADGSVGVDKVFKEFLAGNRPLLNQGYEPWLPPGETVDSIAAKCFSGGKPTADSYRQMARCQLVKGAFNVNSTSVQAWMAMLSALNHSELATLWAKSGLLELRKSNGTPIPAMSLPNGGSSGQPVNPGNSDNVVSSEWNSCRELTAADVELLATRIVEQVRTRGPFLSLSEFVNRRIGSDSELTRSGALQTAINKSGINDRMFKSQIPVTVADVSDPRLYNFKTPDSAAGNPAEGAPGWICQGDLMRLLEPAATIRSDTFVIRTCGEASDASGKVVARAYAEAVVQRVPEFVDPADDSSVNIYQQENASKVNKAFGRRIGVVSFRWLTPSEI